MSGPSPYDLRALRAAERLSRALARHHITADVHDGYGLALVSVWTGLIVWCNGDRFWWRAGWDAQRRRPVYASHRGGEPQEAADRIARHYMRLRARHPEPQRLRADPV